MIESITTTVIIETDNPKKGFKLVDKMVKKGFIHQSTKMNIPKVLDGIYKFELTKTEQFK